jgi:hypothetical protein
MPHQQGPVKTIFVRPHKSRQPRPHLRLFFRQRPVRRQLLQQSRPAHSVGQSLQAGAGASTTGIFASVFGAITRIDPRDGGSTCNSGIEHGRVSGGVTTRTRSGMRRPARKWNFCFDRSLWKSFFPLSSGCAAREQAAMSSIEILHMRL